MRRLTALAVFFFAAVFCVFAQDGAPTTTTTSAPTWSGVWNAGFYRQYYGNIVSKVFAHQPVVWNALTLNRRLDDKTTWCVNVWNSEGFLRSSFGTFANETDLGTCIARQVGKFSVSGTGTIFLLNPNAGTDVVVLAARVSRTFARGGNAFTPYAEIQQFMVTSKDVGYHGGIYPFLGMDYARKLTGRLSLVTHFHEHRDLSGAFGEKKGANLFYGEAGLRIAVKESFAITFPRIGYGGSWDDPNRPRRTTWSAGITKTF